jgi:hypothetical protein
VTPFDKAIETDAHLEVDDEVEAASAPVFRMIGKTGGLCLDDSCSIEQYLDPEPA